MDPIDPISPGLGPPRRVADGPIERLERISRERDRPAHERPRPERRRPAPHKPRGRDDGDEDGPRHVDVRA